MTTVLIVDDQALQRSGVRLLLEQHPDLTVVGEAAHGAEGVRKAAELNPDVVLMDGHMPGMDGIEATRRIVESGGRSHVLVLTTFDRDEYAYDVLRAGAHGFLLKTALPGELVAAVRAVATGAEVIAPSLPHELIGACSGRVCGRAPGQERHLDPLTRREPDSLTRREREVLTAIASGWNNLEIGQRLSLAESTVKTHVSRVLTKIGARDRVQAVIFAYDTGLVRPA
ncbi:response regulator [Streptomyces sp. NPDC020898]|uniref:response regulator n=1 Tax=Streptomyces sp. NPDC020898 TaxID=3365101 RepID=UPI0037AA5732